MENYLMIDKKLALVPHKPGCYLMKDENGIIIYVGKSKNLKNRLSSYFKQTHTGKTAMLVRDISDFDYIITSSNLEALLLEINLQLFFDLKLNIFLVSQFIEKFDKFKYFNLLHSQNIHDISLTF